MCVCVCVCVHVRSTAGILGVGTQVDVQVLRSCFIRNAEFTAQNNLVKTVIKVLCDKTHQSLLLISNVTALQLSEME